MYIYKRKRKMVWFIALLIIMPLIISCFKTPEEKAVHIANEITKVLCESALSGKTPQHPNLWRSDDLPLINMHPDNNPDRTLNFFSEELKGGYSLSFLEAAILTDSSGKDLFYEHPQYNVLVITSKKKLVVHLSYLPPHAESGLPIQFYVAGFSYPIGTKVTHYLMCCMGGRSCRSCINLKSRDLSERSARISSISKQEGRSG